MKMAFRFAAMTSFVVPLLSMLLGAAYSHASPPTTPSRELYWATMFPNTPMPKVLANLISPDDFRGDYFHSVLSEMVTKLAGPPGGDPELKYEFPADETDQFSANSVHPDVFFLETKLRSGSKMDAEELRMEANKASFLPRSIAESIPFSSLNISEILTHFSVHPESLESLIVKEVIQLCERPPLPGELKNCCTSFEALLDYAVLLLGKRVTLLTPHLESRTRNANFSVGDGTQRVASSAVLCHKLDYAYAVFLCHSTRRTDIYVVPLIGDDGSRGTSLAACHQDTSSWSPNHLAFQVLKVQPGTMPICHFLKKGTVVWVPLPPTS